MAGSKRQIRVGAAVLALATMMIAGQAMAMQVPRGGLAKLPHWYGINISRSAEPIRSPLKEFRARLAELGGKVGWSLTRAGR
ncbi:MAG: hypothetical protein ACHQ52_10600 [Candidatus Eisenbacteria bacterium]